MLIEEQIPNGWYNIIGKTGLCVSAKNNNGRLVQENCGSADELLWKSYPYSNGLIIENKTGRVMDNSGQGAKNGNGVLGYAKNLTPAQVWVIESVHNGDHVHFRNIQRNKCLDDTGNANVGQLYHIWDCNNGNRNQWFVLVAPKAVVAVGVPNGWYNIIGKTGLCVSAKNNNGRLVQENCGSADELLWKSYPHSNGLIIENKTGRVMDNSGQGAKNGNGVLGYAYHGGPNQVWVIESVHNGDHVHFRNIQRNKCLDDTGNANVGQLYHIWDCNNGNRNQWFVLVAPKAPTVVPAPTVLPVPVPTVVLPAPTVVPAMKLPTGFFNIVGPQGLCMSANSKNAQNLVQETCSSDESLEWEFISHNNGYVIKNKNGFVIDNSGSKTNNGNPIIGYTYHGGPNQIWVFELVDKVHFHIKNPASEKCIDSTKTVKIGQKYKLWDCKNTYQFQMFMIATPHTTTAPTVVPAPTVLPVPVPTVVLPVIAKPSDPTFYKN